MKHTPGPWEIDTTLHEEDPITIIETIHGRTIAEVIEWGESNNARLIAAAPELLEALKTAHDMLVAYDFYLVKHAELKIPASTFHSKITPAMHVLSKAIAKATAVFLMRRGRLVK